VPKKDSAPVKPTSGSSIWRPNQRRAAALTKCILSEASKISVGSGCHSSAFRGTGDVSNAVGEPGWGAGVSIGCMYPLARVGLQSRYTIPGTVVPWLACCRSQH
jgi:hypothetical protein